MYTFNTRPLPYKIYYERFYVYNLYLMHEQNSLI